MGGDWTTLQWSAQDFLVERENGKPFQKNYPQYTQPGLNHDLPIVDSLSLYGIQILGEVDQKRGLEGTWKKEIESPSNTLVAVEDSSR
uniref:Uncharacterized protein n=1 Tax=Timema bartmani TaxID=61472 RepID=A0A7R9ENQ1_9NEOP|nr:unnamed protein product [Timema bartmani]